MAVAATSGGAPVFRSLTRADFPLLRRWLTEPLVARWWNHRTTDEALEKDFGPSIDAQEASEVFLAVCDSRPVGLVQRYPLEAYAEDLAELTAVCPVPPGAVSIDYFLGEPDARGRGLGAGMIAAFVADSWARYPDSRHVVVPVAAGNTASWRALERAGFTRIGEGPLVPDNPVDPPDHVVYALERP